MKPDGHCYPLSSLSKLRSPASDSHSCLSLFFLHIRPLPGVLGQPPFSCRHLLVRDDRSPRGQGKVKALWLRSSCLSGSLWCPSWPVKAFPSLEKLGQPAFTQLGLVICGRPLSGRALGLRPGLRTVWNAGREDYRGATNRGPKVSWLGVILTAAQLWDL